MFPYIVEPPESMMDIPDKHAWNKTNAPSPAWKNGVSARTTRGIASLRTPNNAIKSPAHKVEEDKKLTGPRIILFIAGGATYSELRVIHKVSKILGRQIILGSTEMLSPKRFLSMLEVIG